ncbi:MAG: DUF488 domain-containing protein [Ktedonobacteraceae bacterium]|nr:DUF488 domain-containing protein [Ktedonobacteraceae bacterium]
MKKIVTTGIYGFAETGFFQALIDANVDTFCDIRLHRGVRGARYTFANSEYLQRRLHESSIRYFHSKELAPARTLRAIQWQEDKTQGVAKHRREALGQAFIAAYERECLAAFDVSAFVAMLGEETQVLALCCVESEPQACHRSLLAAYLARELRLPVEHIRP